MVMTEKRINIAQEKMYDFVMLCKTDSEDFRLTPKSDISPYALCFAIFSLHLLKEDTYLKDKKEVLAEKLNANLRAMRDNKSTSIYSKPFMQLLTMTLSAFSVLNMLRKYDLSDIISNYTNVDMISILHRHKCAEGIPQSGNMAMFYAIIHIYARDYLGFKTNMSIQSWVEYHLNYQNEFGFWGKNKSMNHLSFQNGYHQYEIFEYLGIENPKHENSISFTASLRDNKGHYAPYPGGGGCYDYDAISILTHYDVSHSINIKSLLTLTQNSILSEQNKDGGWSESRYVPSTNIKHLKMHLCTIVKAANNQSLFFERLRYFIAVNRSKNSRIHTHWSNYSRKWNESDLWDTWFRMLTIARIQVYNSPDKYKKWGFIDFPGIGYLKQNGSQR